MRTISLRLRGTSLEVLEELGEETDGVVESTSKLQEKIKALSGVDILTESGGYKNTYTILREIGQVWQDMNDLDQAALLELMSGKNRANTLSAILSNMKDLEGAYNDALSAEGSAVEENLKWMDSIEGKTQQFKNATQTMWANFIDSDTIKSVVDFGTTTVEFLDKIGAGLTTILGLLLSIPATLTAKGFKSWFSDDKGAKKLGTEITKSFSGAKKMATKAFTAIAAIPTPLKIAAGAATVAAIALAHYSKAEEEAALAAQENAAEIKKERDSLEEYKQQISDLRYELDHGNLSEEEAYDVRKQLISIQDELISKYGKEAQGINLVTGAISDQTNALNGLSEASANKWLTDNSKGTGFLGLGKSAIEQAKDAMEDIETIHLRTVNTKWEKAFKDAYGDNWEKESEVATSELRSIVEELGGTLVSIDGGINFKNINRQELEDAFNQISNWFTEYGIGELDLTGVLGEIKTDVDNRLGDDWSTHKENFDAYLENTAITKYTEEYYDIIAAQEKLQNAITSGDTEEILKSRDELSDAIEAAKAKAGKDVWQVDWFDGLDDQWVDSVSAIEFKDAFKKNTDGIAAGLKTAITEASKEVEHDLTDAELLNMSQFVTVGDDGTFDWGEHDDEFSDKQKVAYEKIAQAAAQYGMEVQDLIPILVQLGVVQGEVFAADDTEQIKAKAYAYSTLKSAIEKYNAAQEVALDLVTDNTEITEEQYEALKEYIDNEELLAECIDTTNGYIVKNVDKLNDAIDATREHSAEQVRLAKTQTRLKYNELYLQLTKLTYAERDQADAIRATMQELEKEISKYSVLEEKILGATDAFDAFERAQQADEESDYVGKVEDMIMTIGEAFQSARLGSEAAQAAILGLVPESVYGHLDTLQEKMDAVFKYFADGPLSKYFYVEYDDDGLITSVESNLAGVQAFVADMQKLGVFTGKDFTEFGIAEGIMSIQDLAEEAGITVEMAFAMLREMENYNISYLNGDYDTLFDDLIVKQSDIYKLGDEMQKKFDQSKVDLLVRPKVSSEEMQEAGWNVPDGDYATVQSVTYSAEELGAEGTWAINVTPILDDGTVLTEGELIEQLTDHLIKGGNAEDFYLSLGVYPDIDSAVKAANELHEYQEKLYGALDDYSFKDELYAVQKQVVDAQAKYFETGSDADYDAWKQIEGYYNALIDGSLQNFNNWMAVNEEIDNTAAKLSQYEKDVSEIQSNIETLTKNYEAGAISKDEYDNVIKQQEKLLEATKSNIATTKEELKGLNAYKNALFDPTEAEALLALDEVDKTINEYEKILQKTYKDFTIEGNIKFNEETGAHEVVGVEILSDDDKELFTELVNLLDTKDGLELFLELGDETTEIEDLMSTADTLNSTIGVLIDTLNGLDTKDWRGKEESEATKPSSKEADYDVAKEYNRASLDSWLYVENEERAERVYNALKQDQKLNPLVDRENLVDLERMNELLQELTFSAMQFDLNPSSMREKVVDLYKLLKDNGYSAETINTIFTEIGNAARNTNFADYIEDGLFGTHTNAWGVDTTMQKIKETLNEFKVHYTQVVNDTTGEISLQVNDEQLTALLTSAGMSEERIEALKEKWEKEKLIITSNFDATGIDEAKSAMNSLSGKTLNINTRFAGLADGGGGYSSANGTAHANGNWGLDNNEHNALLGELGQELVVNPSTGRYYTVGDHGAEMTDLPKGAIIFNHKQTEQLLKNGHINSRGKAYASGNAYAFTRESGTIGNLFGGKSAAKAYSDLRKEQFKTTKAVTNMAKVATEAAKEMNLTNAFNNVVTYTDQSNKKYKETTKGYGTGSGGGSDSSDKDDSETVVDFIEFKLEEIEDIISKSTAKIENYVDDTSQLSAKDARYDELVAAEKDKAQTYLAAAEEYDKRAAKLLKEVPEKYRKMAQNGAIKIEDFVGESETEIADAISNYREWAQKADDAENAHLEAIAQISAYRLEQFNDIVSDYENLIGVIESNSNLMQAKMDLAEASGERLSEGNYEYLIANTKKTIKELNKESKALRKNLVEAVEAGEVQEGSDDWYEMVNAISSVDEQIIESKISIEEFQNAINDLKWDNLDKLISRFDALDSELSHIYDRLTDNDKAVDQDTGEWTDEGIAAMGTVAQQMEVAQYKAEQYRQAINDLKKDYKKGLYSTDEYNEKFAELTENQWDSIEAYEDAKDKLVDLNKTRIDAVKEGMQKEIDAYKELIDKQKELLDAEKDLHDFEKSIADKEKEISDIQRKIDAMRTDSSASATAQRKQLEAELAIAKEELNELYYDRSIENQKEALDTEYENYEESMNDEMEVLDKWLEDEEQVVLESLNTVKKNTDIVLQEMEELSDKYGVQISSHVTQPWQDGSNAISGYKTAFGDLCDSFSKELDELITKEKALRDAAEAAAEAAALSVGGSISGTNLGGNSNSNNDSKPVTNDNKSAATTPVTEDKNNNTSATTYTVKSGDTLSEIVQKEYGLSGSALYNKVNEVAQANGLKDANNINVGQKIELPKYAKGTLSVKEDQWAWIDEIGEELVMHAGTDGKISYLTKGSSVIPSDLTEKLMRLAVDPTQALENSRPVINAPHITNNEINIDASIAEVIHIDTVTNDTLPDLTKVVEKQMDKYVKGLNAQIRKYTR